MSDKSLEKLNPFTVRGRTLKEKAEQLKVETFEDLTTANEALKECQTVEKEIEAKRVELTKPLVDMQRQLNNLAKEVAIPTIEAKSVIKQKILAFNEEQERKRRAEEEAERKRLEEARKREEAEKKAREEAERKIREEEERKLAEKKRELEEAKKKAQQEADETSRKLAEMKAKQAEEEARLEAERIKLEQDKRDLEAEKARIEAEKKEAELQKEREAKEKELAKQKVKGIRKTWKYEVVDTTKVPRNFCVPSDQLIREAIKNGVREIPGVRIYSESTVQ